MFNLVLGLQEVEKDVVKINSRGAVRAVVFKDNTVLMVQTNKGDYKFPGGGVKKGESHEEALIREVREETGFIINKVHNKIGIVIERNQDIYEQDSVFEMVSYYYSCEVSDEQQNQQLDDYEENQQFRPEWIALDNGILVNESILKKNDINPWVQRETAVLNALKEVYSKGNTT